jgi:Domain of unknown function (DUF4410)
MAQPTTTRPGWAWQIALASSLLLVAGCASIKITDRDEYKGAKLARPDQILVHDFAVTVDDLPEWSEAAKVHAGDPARPSAEELEIGRKLGSQMAHVLVGRIDEMGLNAERVVTGSEARDGDIVIVGYLTSLDEGSGVKRVLLGFGSGAAEVTSQVEGYLATNDGMRRLGSGGATSGAGKSPGAVVPIIVTIVTKNPIGLLVTTPIKVGGEMAGKGQIEDVGEKMADKIADELEIKFQQQGWIAD